MTVYNAVYQPCYQHDVKIVLAAAGEVPWQPGLPVAHPARGGRAVAVQGRGRERRARRGRRRRPLRLRQVQERLRRLADAAPAAVTQTKEEREE